MCEIAASRGISSSRACTSTTAVHVLELCPAPCHCALAASQSSSLCVFCQGETNHRVSGCSIAVPTATSRAPAMRVSCCMPCACCFGLPGAFIAARASPQLMLCACMQGTLVHQLPLFSVLVLTRSWCTTRLCVCVCALCEEDTQPRDRKVALQQRRRWALGLLSQLGIGGLACFCCPLCLCAVAANCRRVYIFASPRLAWVPHLLRPWLPVQVCRVWLLEAREIED